MSEIIFIRHAATDMAGKFCGHSDPALNSHGRAQLARLLQELSDAEFGNVFSSDLIRARQTADAVAQHFGLEVVERPGLREIYFGEWEGLSWSEIEKRDSILARRWVDEYPRLPAPAGESLEQFETRVVNELAFLVYAANRSPIVVVTHAGFLQVALRRLRGDADLGSAPDYASVVRLNQSGKIGHKSRGINNAICSSQADMLAQSSSQPKTTQ